MAKDDIKLQNEVTEDVTPTNSDVNLGGEQASGGIPGITDSREDIIQEERIPDIPEEEEVIPTQEPKKEEPIIKPISEKKEEIPVVEEKIPIIEKVEELPVEKSQERVFAEQNSIQARTNEDGTTTFLPKSIDEAIDLFNQFGPSAKIDKNSKEFLVGTKAFQTYSKYKGASTDTYLQGLKTNQIGTSGETWERLVKMNGGQPTAEMLKAQEEYERGLKINNTNDTIKISGGKKLEDQEKILKSDIETLDADFIKATTSLYGELANNWNNFKAGNEKLSNLNASLTENANKRLTLQKAKRQVLDKIKERNPRASLGQQLTIAGQELDAIDDQLFQLGIEYNSDFSTYKFENEKAKGEFEFGAKMIENKMKFMTDFYGVQRGDIIRQETFDRQDKLLANSITRADKLLAEAIDRQDEVGAKNQAYKIAIMKEQAAINKEMKQKFTFQNIGSGISLKSNIFTGEFEFISPGDIPKSTVTATGNIVPFDITTPGGATKTLNVDESAKQSLEDAIESFRREAPGGLDIIVGDTHRTRSEQQKLFDAFEAGTGGLAAKPGTSKHETGLAVDIYSGQDENGNLLPLTTEQTQFMNSQGWFQTAGKDDLGHFEFRGTGKKGVDGVDSELEIKFNFVKSQLTSKLKDSDSEKADIRTFTELMHNKGLNEFEIADIYSGFRIEPGDVFGKNIRNLVGTTGSKDDMGELGRAIAIGEKSQAVRTIYLNAGKKAKADNGEDFISETFVSVADNQVNKVLDVMKEKGLESGIGVAEGTLENFIGSKFKGETAQKIQTEILNITAALSTKMSGTAKTEAELKFIADLLPNIGDSPANFFIKLNNLKDFPLSQYNSQMTRFGLPELDSNTLQNINARTSLFESGDIFNTQQPTPPTPTQEPTQTNTNGTFRSNYQNRNTENTSVDADIY